MEKVDRVRECWPPVATVPGPVLSGGILSCSGSTCRPPRRTDQHCDRGGAPGGKEQKILLRTGTTDFPHLRPGNVLTLIDLPSQVLVHHLHLVLQLALVCSQQLESTETSANMTQCVPISYPLQQPCQAHDRRSVAGGLILTVGYQRTVNKLLITATGTTLKTVTLWKNFTFWSKSGPRPTLWKIKPLLSSLSYLLRSNIW